MPNQIVLLHGYSDEGKSFARWAEILRDAGYPVETIGTCTYKTLTNEVTLKDVAEAFDRALQERVGLDPEEPFDAIVHSTGMLVIRAWLTTYGASRREMRRGRLKRLIGLAPATFGSPLAHKGRSWLGALIKGNKVLGPDFLEAGDQILDALELGSKFTWALTHLDLLGKETFYGVNQATPYVFIFCGTKGYSGLASVVNAPGTDGTVRWAGCALNTRKITVDLMHDPAGPALSERIRVAPWTNADIPLIPMDGLNHNTILHKPSDALIALVRRALEVDDADAFRRWQADALAETKAAREGMPQWQQFVVRAVDERGDAIPDFHLQLISGAHDKARRVKAFDMDVHTYTTDSSLRCFHVNLDDLQPESLADLRVRVIASSGSQLVGYHGFGSEKTDQDLTALNPEGTWDAQIDVDSSWTTPDGQTVKLFEPFTTTLIELRLNREPMPLVGTNKVCWFEGQ
jgi:hypothetical protein